MLPHGIIRTVIFGRHQAQERVVLLAANIAVADCRGIKINTNTPRHSPVRLEFINLIIGYHRTGQFAGARRASQGKPNRQIFWVAVNRLHPAASR